MSLEIAVRPFSNVNVLKSGGQETEPAADDREALIEWGAGPLGMLARSEAGPGGLGASDFGDIGNFDWQDNFALPPPSTPQYLFSEIERKTHTVRVEQAGKPENYVEVEVIDAIAFTSPYGVWVFTFNNPA